MHRIRASKWQKSVLVAQLCPTLCNTMVCSLPGSSEPGILHVILQARMLEWVAMPSSKGSSQPRDQTHISYVSCIGRWILYHSLMPPGKPATYSST